MLQVTKQRTKRKIATAADPTDEASAAAEVEASGTAPAGADTEVEPVDTAEIGEPKDAISSA